MSLFFADVRQRHDLQILIWRYQIGLFPSVQVDECVLLWIADGSKREKKLVVGLLVLLSTERVKKQRKKSFEIE